MRCVDVLAAVLAALALAACASGPSKVPPAQARTGAAPSMPFEELPPQRLQSGQCALFLWSHSAAARRIVMVSSDPAMARVRIAGRTRDLPRTGWDGTSALGQSAHQAFSADGVTLTLDLDLGDRRELPGGAVVPRGSLDYRDPSGWSIVLPIGGLIACQDNVPAPRGP